MALITRDEIIKLANISNISIHEDEIDGLIKQVEDVLLYAARVQEITYQGDPFEARNVNVMRDDLVITTDREPLLAQAPRVEEGYFVVPAILEQAS